MMVWRRIENSIEREKGRGWNKIKINKKKYKEKNNNKVEEEERLGWDRREASMRKKAVWSWAETQRLGKFI